MERCPGGNLRALLSMPPYPADCVNRWDVGHSRTGFRFLPKDGVARHRHDLKGKRLVGDDEQGVLAALVLTTSHRDGEPICLKSLTKRPRHTRFAKPADGGGPSDVKRDLTAFSQSGFGTISVRTHSNCVVARRGIFSGHHRAHRAGAAEGHHPGQWDDYDISGFSLTVRLRRILFGHCALNPRQAVQLLKEGLMCRRNARRARRNFF